MSIIGKIEDVPIREVWSHEERGFSMWLKDNLDLLAETIGFDTLTLLEREKKVGTFELDLLAEDRNNNLVIIENQLEATNHDHLGKVLTYFSNLDAKTAVWIVTDARPEHVKAIDWLNEISPDDIAFFLVKLAAYRIGSSEPAPMFTLITAPSEDTKMVGREKEKLAGRSAERFEFWSQLIERLKNKKISLHANLSPSTQGWLAAGAGRSGFVFSYLVWLKKESGGELWIDTGNKDRNKIFFDKLFSHKQDIEKQFIVPLQWQRMDYARGCRIQYRLEIGGLEDREKWNDTQEKMVDVMQTFVAIIRPYIGSLSE